MISSNKDNIKSLDVYYFRGFKDLYVVATFHDDTVQELFCLSEKGDIILGYNRIRAPRESSLWMYMNVGKLT